VTTDYPLAGVKKYESFFLLYGHRISWLSVKNVAKLEKQWPLCVVHSLKNAHMSV
jgi:hypothetical protein